MVSAAQYKTHCMHSIFQTIHNNTLKLNASRGNLKIIQLLGHIATSGKIPYSSVYTNKLYEQTNCKLEAETLTIPLTSSSPSSLDDRDNVRKLLIIKRQTNILSSKFLSNLESQFSVQCLAVHIEHRIGSRIVKHENSHNSRAHHRLKDKSPTPPPANTHHQGWIRPYRGPNKQAKKQQ